MALIACTSPRKLLLRKSAAKEREERKGLSSPSNSVEMYHDCREDDDSGCECSLEEIERMENMDAWSKTLVAIRVLTEFKKRRKKTLEAEKAKKERRKNLWRRLRLKLRIFNLFANKISSEDPAVDRILKLKRKIGDVTIESEEDAYRYQIKIEESFQRQLGFRLKTGDSILTHFDAMPNENKKQRGRRKSKIFERTHSYDEMNPRTKQKCRNPPRSRGLYSASRLLLEPGGDSSRRRSWHNEYLNNSMTDLVRFKGGPSYPSPIVIVSAPESIKHINLTLVPLPGVASTVLDTPYKHYVQTRPCIVSRNLRKIFRK